MSRKARVQTRLRPPETLRRQAIERTRSARHEEQYQSRLRLRRRHKRGNGK